jgi:hypothetical protein
MEQEISAPDSVSEGSNAAFPFLIINIVKHLIANLHGADRSFTCVQDDKYNSGNTSAKSGFFVNFFAFFRP